MLYYRECRLCSVVSPSSFNTLYCLPRDYRLIFPTGKFGSFLALRRVLLLTVDRLETALFAAVESGTFYGCFLPAFDLFFARAGIREPEGALTRFFAVYSLGINR